MSFLGPEYRFAVYDKTGNPKEYFKDFLSLSIDAVWGGKGSYRVSISGFDKRTEKIEQDDLIVVSLKDLSVGIVDWVDIFYGFAKTPIRSLSQGGQRTYQSFGPSLEELLAKEYIFWYSGSAQATKSGNVSPVMAEYVSENIGALALAANGRDVDGVVAGLSVVGYGAGPAWSGSKARKPLLKTIQDLRAFSIEQNDQIDFRVVWTGGYNFRFECGQLGVDRTTIGLDHTTGLNGAGNRPVIFSEGARNIESFTRSQPRTNAVTQIVALGSGKEINRAIGIATDPAAFASPIARRSDTISVNSNDQTVLDNAAAEELARQKPDDNFFFQPKDANAVFNRDYFLGDFITAQDSGDEFHKQVVKVSYSISGGLPNRTIDFADI